MNFGCNSRVPVYRRVVQPSTDVLLIKTLREEQSPVPEETVEGKRTKKVGIWIRVSTEDQARGESPEHHERRARYYTESKDWIIKN